MKGMDQDVLQTTLQINGVCMGVVVYDVGGPQMATSGGTLVLLHGFTGSAMGWGELLPRLALPGWRVVALDMLGHGASAAPADPERYSIEHCQQDVIAALRELGVQPGEAVLLGYSMGGRIALYCAFAGFFRALVLESASPGLASPAEREQRRESDNALAARIERDGVPAFVRYWEQIPLFASQQSLAAAVHEFLHEQRLHNSPQGLAQSLRGVGTGVQPALHERLAQLDLPILLLAGALDQKFCTIARHMYDVLPRAQLHIVPGAGHTVHLEQPASFTTLVREFCLSLV
ncbi:MAG TPA: 2-succinyl-6-hydroxy-2,4-cyclohexadiene-1-carboxylate synthase [Ktedonobacteraceae bacterium]|nr:2-succinyl-6-hydroxy-2,4-cyclohexadiene-1-carboxylate synthase [Ktedonobacteraceae bacterium]